MDNAVWLLGVLTSLSLRTYISDSAIAVLFIVFLVGLIAFVQMVLSMHDLRTIHISSILLQMIEHENAVAMLGKGAVVAMLLPAGSILPDV